MSNVAAALLLILGRATPGHKVKSAGAVIVPPLSNSGTSTKIVLEEVHPAALVTKTVILECPVIAVV